MLPGNNLRDNSFMDPDPNRIDPEKVRCKGCGAKVCICPFGEKWAAHCMDCDNSIGKRGYYDPCADSEKEAGFLWMQLNLECTVDIYSSRVCNIGTKSCTTIHKV